MSSLKISLMVICTLGLSACGAYTEHFKCKAQPGLGCCSISQVNDLVNQGWPLRDARKKESDKKPSFFERLLKPRRSKKVQSSETFALPLQNFLNDNPQTLRIWIAPYKVDNQYCDAQFVYHSLDPVKPAISEHFNAQMETL